MNRHYWQNVFCMDLLNVLKWSLVLGQNELLRAGRYSSKAHMYLVCSKCNIKRHLILLVKLRKEKCYFRYFGGCVQ